MRNPLLILALTLFLVPSAAASVYDRGDTIYYQTNFSTDPFWETNNPSSFYWMEDGRYHYLLVGGTNSYACKRVFPDDLTPFRLSFDVTPERCDMNAALRFGLFDSDMDINGGSCLYAELFCNKYGHLFRMRGIGRAGNAVEVNSHRDSYGGPTVRYELNRTYRVVIDHDPVDMTLQIAVYDKATMEKIWQTNTSLGQAFSGLKKLGFSTVGLYGHTSRVAEGTIDNVIFRQLPGGAETPTVTPIPSFTPPPTTATPPTSTTAPATTPITPLPLFLVLIAVIAAACLRNPGR